ncbi:hypothetical protein [Sphingomonas psychrolutea]|uniref:Glycerophosphoryl diester phosphodiesterase membrane domain-containing protein n=1 Tax=Sphingomonas psychrolutea TaxID=1259676 RepID=A0ABQ1GBY7_9SPHN|nr:hypothetical protein [Sphingomonas psychrolutea]GGA40815.1 hypothetical protein GCM10011395_08830 [Sphingomonas psychrolutea]
MIATMSTVWDRTAEFLSDNLAALTPIVLLGIFVPLTLLGNLMPLMGSSGQVGDWALGAIVFVLALVTTWGGIAITALAFDPGAGRGSAVATANRRIAPVLGIGLVTTLAVLLLAVPIAVALGMSGLDMTAMAAGKPPTGVVNGWALSFATFYMIAFAVFLLWAYARLVLLITPIMVMERRGLGVYARAFVLTRGIAWKVIGVLLLYAIVSWVASAAAKTVFGSVFGLLIGGTGPITLASVLTQIAVATISTLFSVLSVAFVAKLYLATRDAREAIVEAT